MIFLFCYPYRGYLIAFEGEVSVCGGYFAFEHIGERHFFAFGEEGCFYCVGSVVIDSDYISVAVFGGLDRLYDRVNVVRLYEAVAGGCFDRGERAVEGVGARRDVGTVNVGFVHVKCV